MKKYVGNEQLPGGVSVTVDWATVRWAIVGEQLPGEQLSASNCLGEHQSGEQVSWYRRRHNVNVSDAINPPETPNSETLNTEVAATSEYRRNNAQQNRPIFRPDCTQNLVPDADRMPTHNANGHLSAQGGAKNAITARLKTILIIVYAERKVKILYECPYSTRTIWFKQWSI